MKRENLVGSSEISDLQLFTPRCIGGERGSFIGACGAARLFRSGADELLNFKVGYHHFKGAFGCFIGTRPLRCPLSLQWAIAAGWLPTLDLNLIASASREGAELRP